jgi:hypothetical protein
VKLKRHKNFTKPKFVYVRDDGAEAADDLSDGQNVDCSGWKRFLEMIVVRSHHRVLDQQVDGRRRRGSSGGRGGHVLRWLRIHDEDETLGKGSFLEYK